MLSGRRYRNFTSLNITRAIQWKLLHFEDTIEVTHNKHMFFPSNNSRANKCDRNTENRPNKRKKSLTQRQKQNKINALQWKKKESFVISPLALDVLINVEKRETYYEELSEASMRLRHQMAHMAGHNEKLTQGTRVCM